MVEVELGRCSWGTDLPFQALGEAVKRQKNLFQHYSKNETLQATHVSGE